MEPTISDSQLAFLSDKWFWIATFTINLIMQAVKRLLTDNQKGTVLVRRLGTLLPVLLGFLFAIPPLLPGTTYWDRASVGFVAGAISVWAYHMLKKRFPQLDVEEEPPPSPPFDKELTDPEVPVPPPDEPV